jgi:hypothetical protein
VVASGKVPGQGIPHETEGALTRLAQLLSAGTIKRSNAEDIESLIADGPVAKQGGANF